MTSRAELQRKCAELKRLGKLRPGERCNASTETLLAIVNRESIESATRASLPLLNDLLTIIATYTTPNLTLELLGFEPNLARIAYSENALIWQSKAAVENRGLLLDTSVILANGSWRAYYFLTDQTYFGDVYAVQAAKKKPKLVVRGMTGIADSSSDGSAMFGIIRGRELFWYDIALTWQFATANGAPYESLVTYPRKVRQATGTGLIITEAGEIYYEEAPNSVLRVGPTEAYFVAMSPWASHLLTRDGAVYRFDRDTRELVPVPMTGRVISIGISSTRQGVGPVALLANGTLVNTKSTKVRSAVRLSGSHIITMTKSGKNGEYPPIGADYWTDPRGGLWIENDRIDLGQHAWKAVRAGGIIFVLAGN